MTDFHHAEADQSAQSHYHESHNPNGQQFFGPIYCCVIVMPGAQLHQTYTSPEGEGNAPAAPSAKPTQAAKRKKASAKAEESFEPTTDTFIRRKGLIDPHFALLLSALQRAGCMDEATSPDSFVALFSGKPAD